MNTITAIPRKSTLTLTPAQRALGRVVGIPTPDAYPATVGLDVAHDLAGDLFWSLYQQTPARLDEDKLAPERAINRRLLDWLAESPVYETSRQSTIASLLAAAMSAGVIHGNLLTDETVREALKKQEEADRKQQEAQGAEAAAQAAAAAGQGDLAQQLRQQAAAARTQAQAQLEAAAQKLNDKLGTPAASAARAVAVQSIQKAADEANQIAAGFGLEAGNPETSQNLPAILDTLKKLPDLAELVKRIAQAKALFGAKLGGKKREESHTLVTDGYTRALNAAFPSEVALLRPDAPGLLRATKVAEYADRGVLGMISQSELKERGGLVIALDASGSMQGERFTLACALALGITQAAGENDQDYRIFKFDHEIRPGGVDSQSDWKTKLDFVAETPDGGTNLDTALTHALMRVQDLAQPENSSIVLLSDGQGHIGAETLQQLDSLRSDSHLKLVYLDVSGNPDAGVQQAANATLVVNDLARNFDRIINQLGEVLA